MLFNRVDDGDGFNLWSMIGLVISFILICITSYYIIYFTVVTIPLFILRKCLEFIGWCVGLIL